MIRHPVATLALFVLLGLSTRASENRHRLFSFEIREKADVLAWFPLQVGNRWIYQNTLQTTLVGAGRTKYPAQTYTGTWTTEVVVTAHHRVPEGLVVLIRIRYDDLRLLSPKQTDEDDKARMNSVIRPACETNYLIRGNYVYEFCRDEWNDAAKSLSERFKASTLDKAAEPAFFFPMKACALV